jgi:hypothetical protein
MANPQAVRGGQSEALSWVWYDTQTYVDATTVQLTYFQQVNNDKTLSNMQSGGTLPDPMFFEIYYVSIDPIVPATSSDTGLTGAWLDMSLLMIVGRPTFRLIVSDKTYGPFPLSFFHSSGGMTGYGFNEAAAGTVQQAYANWGIFDGGWPVDGALIIPPNAGFSVQLDWAAAQDITTDRQIRVNMAGVLHRKVL